MCAESVLDVVGDGWVQDVASHVVGGGFATDRQAGVRSGSRTRSGGGLRSLVLPRAVVQGSFLGALGVAGVFLGPGEFGDEPLAGEVESQAGFSDAPRVGPIGSGLVVLACLIGQLGVGTGATPRFTALEFRFPARARSWPPFKQCHP